MNESFLKVALLAVLGFCASGCAGLMFANRGVGNGILYASSSTNEEVTENALGAKQGESCASSILGLITTGDASAATAAKKAGITKVASVDNAYDNILGLYASYCVTVTGE